MPSLPTGRCTRRRSTRIIGVKVFSNYNVAAIGRPHRLVAVLPDLGTVRTLSRKFCRTRWWAKRRANVFAEGQAMLGENHRREMAGRKRGHRIISRQQRSATTSKSTRTNRARSGGDALPQPAPAEAQRPRGKPNYCKLADFVAPEESEVKDYIGAFAATSRASASRRGWEKEFEAQRTTTTAAIMLKSLADRLAEAFAEHLHTARAARVLGLCCG